MRIKLILCIFLILPCVISAAPAQAPATVAYQIELVVYSHFNAKGLNSERWPLYDSAKPSLDKVTQLQNKGDDSYTLIPRSDFRLNKIEKKLAQSPDYQILLHIAWREPLNDLARKDTPWIHIYGGKGYNDQGAVITQTSDDTIAYDEAAFWQVDGLLHIDLNRYFNTHFDLFFAAPMNQVQELSTTDNFADNDNPLAYFQLNQKRRMRSKELNYIGHPLYGVLVDIKKVEAPN